MGQFLTILSRQKRSRPQLQFFYNHSLTKIAQFYEQYKSISDTLAIDDSEFTEIFGEQNLSVFEILDTDKNLLIDGLELFAGLVLYSKIIKFEDKIQFLFNLFDFNEQNSLFPNDIEFMFLSCCTFTHKIYGLKSQMNEVWIEEFVRGEFFNGELKINISEILRWSKQSAIITIFFEQILSRPETDTSSILDKMIHIKTFTSPPPQKDSPETLEINQNLYQKFITKIKDKLQTFHQEKLQYTNSDVCFDVNWAYGVRIDDVKRVMKVIEYDNGQMEIVYLVGKLCVLYNKQAKRQRHYREHKRPLLSLDINPSRRIIATGEQGDSPSIRIWSYQTFQTIQVVQTSHKNGIHIINFSKDGFFAVHVGCNSEGSLNITNLISNELIYSCYCSTPIVDINEIDNFTNVFMIESLMTGLYEVNHMTLTVGEYFQAVKQPDQRRAQIYIKDHFIEACEFTTDGKPVSKITCSSFIMINRNFSYLDEYDETYNKYILTGHQQGQVNVWNPEFKTLQFQLCQQKAEIIKIVTTREHVIIISDSSYISFWDIALDKKERSKVIDITEISYHLHSYNVRDLVPLKGKDEYLVCTAKGDVFVLGQEIKENEVVKFSMVEKDYQVELIEEIFPIEGSIVGSKLLTKLNQGRSYQELYYGGEFGVIFTINVKTHLRVAAWNIGEKIVHFDVAQAKHNGTVIAAATSSNKIYLKMGHVECTQKILIKDDILFLLLSPDTSTLIISTNYYDQNNILIFTITPKLTYQLSNTIPIPQKVVFLELIEKKSLLCITETNEVLLLSLKDMHFKPFQHIQRSFPNPVVGVVYWLKEKEGRYLPVVVGAEVKAVLMARVDGTILAWRNQDELELGSRVELYAHSSFCSSLVLNQEQTRLYSSGFSDNLLIQWSLKFFMQKNTATTAHLLKVEPIDEDQDQFLERQSAFCVFKNNLLTEMYDQHLFVRGIGSNNDTLSKLFRSMLQEWKLVNQTSPNIKDEPTLGLKLDFVLGMEVFNKTETVVSLKNRKIAYFVSRVIVIYDPNLNKQEIYTGHRFKVTCIKKLEGKKGEELIASGESSYKPQIHIWSTESLQTIKIIETSHRCGIINITIENDRLLSYGFCQNSNNSTEQPTLHSNKPLNYQFQSMNIWTNSPIATLVSKHPAYCMRIHPTKDQIVISTYGCLIFYSNQFGFYKKKSFCNVEDQHVTCMQFYEIKANKKVQYDLLVGTRKGTIGMICQERNFVVVKSRAHEQRINCLLKIQVGRDMYFVTTSQDQMIKIWSKKFALMYFSEMKKTESDDILKGNFDRKGTDVSYLRNRAVQSLTVFSTNQQSKNPTLLLGTRNGDIFQLMLETDFTEKDPFRNSKYLLYSKNNITQSHLLETKKVLLAHHPKLEIIVTIGEDQNLLFWDTEASGGGNRFIFSKYLGYTSIPTAMKFTKDGDYLIIGFSDGLLIFLDSKITKSIQGKTDDKFLMPSLSLIKKQKAEQNNAILNIELNDSGEHLAVSYNYKIMQTKDKKPLLSNSFIALFNNKTRDKVKNFSKLDSGKIFQKFTSITCPYAESIYKTEKNNQYGMAAYLMTFAQGEGKFYLLIFYQLIDSFQNRLNYSTEGKYSVWDVSTSTMIANLDLVGSLNWKKLIFQNSIYSKYMFWKNLIEYKGRINTESEPINNNLYIPHMSALVNIPNHLILGSVNGDLHIVKSSALEFDGSNPQQKDMFIAKTYPGHCSEVNQIQINPEKVYIYTTSILDECIFKYRIEGSTKINMDEQSFYENSTSGDIFNEVPSMEDFQKMLAIYEAKQKLESRRWIDTQNFLQKMAIIEVIGRRASSMRHNIFIDCGRNIIYHIGQSIINWTPETHQKKFIYSSDSSFSQLNQITQLQITQDNRSVVASHSGLQRSTIVMWQTNCKNTLKEFYVNGMCCVILMALNHDNSRLVLYGIDKSGKAMMIMVDVSANRPLAVVSYAHKPVWAIKAITFAEESQSIFYTCGVEETKKWTFSGSQLTYQELSNEFVSNKKIINLAILVLNKTLLTGADDGSVMVWKSEVIKRQGHDSMVTCLTKDKSGPVNVFYSGGKDGNLIIWTLQPNALVIVKKLSIINSSTLLQKHASLTIKQTTFNHQIQSIYAFRSQLVIGTRNGNIYHSTHEALTALHEQAPIKQLFAFHDFEVTQSLFFNPQETQLYEISKDGLFNIWLIKEYRLMYSNAFREETVDMKYHYKSGTVFVAFRKQLRVFLVEKQDVGVNIVTNQPNSLNPNPQSPQHPTSKPSHYKLRQLPQLSIALKHITHLTFSNNEKMLSLGIESNSDKSIYIEIYEVPEDLPSNQTQLKKLFKISLAAPIQFIDFSLNNKFLLICLSDMVIIRDLAESKNVNQELIGKIEWCNRGVMYGKEAEVAIGEWVNRWGAGVVGVGSGRRQAKSKFSKSNQSETLRQNSKEKTEKGKRFSSSVQRSQQPKDKSLQSSQQPPLASTSLLKRLQPLQQLSQLSNLTVSRLQNQRFLLIQKHGSLYIYHMQNMVSKLTLPITSIDHFSVSANKNFVAVACEVDRMVVVVDVRRCGVRGVVGKE